MNNEIKTRLGLKQSVIDAIKGNNTLIASIVLYFDVHYKTVERYLSTNSPKLQEIGCLQVIAKGLKRLPEEPLTNLCENILITE